MASASNQNPNLTSDSTSDGSKEKQDEFNAETPQQDRSVAGDYVSETPNSVVEEFQVLYKTDGLAAIAKKRNKKEVSEDRFRSLLVSVTDTQAAIEITNTDIVAEPLPKVKRVSFSKKKNQTRILSQSTESGEPSGEASERSPGDTPKVVRRLSGRDDDTISEITDAYTSTSSSNTVSSDRVGKVTQPMGSSSNVVVPSEETWVPPAQPMFQIKRSAGNDEIKRGHERRDDAGCSPAASTLTMENEDQNQEFDEVYLEYTTVLKKATELPSQNSSHSSLKPPVGSSFSTDDQSGPAGFSTYFALSSSSSGGSAIGQRDVSNQSDADASTIMVQSDNAVVLSGRISSLDSMESDVHYVADPRTPTDDLNSTDAVTTASAVYSDALSSYLSSDDAVILSVQSNDADTITTGFFTDSPVPVASDPSLNKKKGGQMDVLSNEIVRGDSSALASVSQQDTAAGPTVHKAGHLVAVAWQSVSEKFISRVDRKQGTDRQGLHFSAQSNLVTNSNNDRNPTELTQAANSSLPSHRSMLIRPGQNLPEDGGKDSSSHDQATTGAGSGRSGETVRRSHVSRPSTFQRAPPPSTPGFVPIRRVSENNNYVDGLHHYEGNDESGPRGDNGLQVTAPDATVRTKERRAAVIICVSLFLVLVVGSATVAGILLSRRGNNDASTPTATPTFEVSTSPSAQFYVRQIIQSILSDVSPDGGAALSYPGTPQSEALDWLLDSNEVSMLSSRRRVIQRYALATIFFSTNGQGWNRNDSWLTIADECTWMNDSGSPCSPNGDLVELELRSNGATGEIPDEIGLLTTLDTIDLSGNNLSRMLPSALWTLQSLKSLVLSDNALSGDITSTGIGKMEQLQRIDLSFNKLSGSIPASISFNLYLTEIRLGFNQLVGSIPDGIGKLTLLKQFDIADNQITGSFPASLFKLSGLEQLSLMGNDFIGQSLPSDIGFLARLVSLRLEFSGLIGSIPSEIGLLSDLQKLDVHGNQHTGSIPTWIGKATSVDWIDLSDNRVNGTLPSELGLLTNLKVLRASDNLMSGSIPSELSTILTFRPEFDFRGNNLNGSVPELFCRQSCCAMGKILIDQTFIQPCSDTTCSEC